MSNCAFGLPSENLAKLGAFSASAAVTGLDAANLASDHGSSATSWHTPAGITAAFVQLDAGTPQAIEAVGLFNTNLTAWATVRLRIGADPAFGTSSYDSGVVPAGVAVGYRQWVAVLPSPVIARYVRIDLADGLNPENMLRAGQMFAGPLRRPLRNFTYDTAFARAATANTNRSRAGQAFVDWRFTERAWRVQLQGLSNDEVWSLVGEIQRTAERGGNLLFLPFPARADLARDAVFGRLVEPSAVSWPAANAPHRRAWSCTITERL